jgi:hypothetical protein
VVFVALSAAPVMLPAEQTMAHRTDSVTRVMTECFAAGWSGAEVKGLWLGLGLSSAECVTHSSKCWHAYRQSSC